MTDPSDTLRIRGGRALGTADATAVRVAATFAGDAESSLRRAAFSAARAANAIQHATWDVDLTADVRAAANALGARADDCALLRDRLLRAAGIYEHGESLVHRLVGMRVGLPALVVLGLSQKLPTSPVKSGVQHLAAPWSDEGTAAAGMLLASPLSSALSDGTAIGGAAFDLAALLHAVLPATTVRVARVEPGGAGSTWDATATSNTIEGTLARIPQLTGRGLVGGDRPAGVPVGTLAVQRVQHDGGKVTWTVIVPGTQELVSTTQPFDGVSDLDLIAHRAADLSAAVEQALDQAGAAPDEKVVLVGHSEGGIVAASLAASAAFRARHPVGAVVTAGSPTASFTLPPGVPALHLENDEELISNLDGRSGDESPATPDRVTVTRSVSASASATDLASATSITAAHGIRTHLRTYALARESHSAQVDAVAARIEPLLRGTSTTTTFYTARRVSGASSERTPR